MKASPTSSGANSHAAFPLQDQCALVTGASRGLGLGIALELARQGARVALNCLRRDDEVDAALRQVEVLAPGSFAVVADVTDEAAVRNMFAEVESRFGRLDILVNNAGTSAAQDIFETSLEDWNRILDTNLTSMFLCTKEAMLAMRGCGGGRIVNISSVVGHQGALKGHAHYAASKAGIIGFTKTVARTGAAHGILVNCVAPGIIETDLLFQTHGREGVEALSRNVPLGLGTCEDIGLSVAFLCGPGGRYITGTVLDVNGGLHMR
jgi:NAD(P)-dependent dehydrogenase (short-subunit alcohol dehydrogenase family)